MFVGYAAEFIKIIFITIRGRESRKGDNANRSKTRSVNGPGKVDKVGTMIGYESGSNPKSVPGVGGRLFISVFFLFFFGMGSVFTWLVAREALAGVRTWTWSKAECQIIRSNVRDTNARGRKTGDFFVDVQYQYRFQGQNFVSDQFRLQAALLRRLRQGGTPGPKIPTRRADDLLCEPETTRRSRSRAREPICSHC